jgi:hypothetical protein
MNRLTFLFLAFIIALNACQAQKKDGDGKHFGDKINDKGSIEYADLVKKMQTEESIETKVVGTVTGVCQAKGCWITLESPADPTNTSMFVKFKDYAFFMPKDLAGKKVVMQGRAFKEITPVDELRHYAEDEGKTKEEIAKITEPKTELKFMASGVLILD